MRKSIAMLSTLALGAASLVGCGEAQTIKVGLFGPLTGEYALYGVAAQQGVELAFEEINAAGGVLGGQLLELVALDTLGAGEQAATVYPQLRDQHEVVAILGGVFSGETLAVKSMMVEDGMPVLSPTATHPDVTVDAPSIFRAAYTDAFQGATAADFIFDELDVTKAAVLFNQDDAYSTGLKDAFVAQFELIGGTVEIGAFSGTDSDFSAQLASLSATGVGAFFVPGYVAEVGPILVQAKTAGITVPFVGADGWDGIEIDYADAAEGHFFLNHYSKTDPAEVVVDFVAAYTERFEEAPNALAALGYDAAYAIAAAIEEAGSTDKAAIVEALSNLSLTDIVTGSLAFDEQGDPVKAITVIQVVAGDHVVHSKIGG